MNLLSNAFKFTDAGSITITASLNPCCGPFSGSSRSSSLPNTSSPTAVARHGKQTRRGGGGWREGGGGVPKNVFGNILGNLLRRFVFFGWKRREEGEGEGKGEGSKGEAGNAAFLRNLQVPTHERAMLVVEVADTGVGIAPEQMDRLFKPFSQVKRRGFAEYKIN